MFKIGVVTHYYDKLRVAVVELTASLGVGDTIQLIRGGEVLFKQKISSLQMNYQQIQSASNGDSVAIELDKEVKPGAEVYKIQEN